MGAFTKLAAAGVKLARSRRHVEDEDVSESDEHTLMDHVMGTSERPTLARKTLAAGGGAVAGDLAGLLLSKMLAVKHPGLSALAALGGPAVGSGVASAMNGADAPEVALAALGAGAGNVAGKVYALTEGVAPLKQRMTSSIGLKEKAPKHPNPLAYPIAFGGAAGLGGAMGLLAGSGLDASMDSIPPELKERWRAGDPDVHR